MFKTYKLTEDPATLKKLVDALQKNYDIRTRGTEVHVSDLVQICLREQGFRRVMPKPITEFTAFYFLLGEACHIAAQKLIDGVKTEVVVKTADKKVQGHVDMVLNLTGTPVEVKTSTARIRFVAQHYITQLMYYMVMLNKRKGHLLYFWLSQGRLPTDPKGTLRSPSFGMYEVTITDLEFATIKADINNKSKLFSKATAEYETGGIGALQQLPAAKFDETKAFKCNSCKYVTECNSID